MIEALLNNETYFFRDRLPFDLLLGGPVKRLEQARAAAKRLSIWCAGCSTGQEAYSLAMSFADEAARWQGWTIDIVGTDLSRSGDRARAHGRLFPVRGAARPAGHADDPLVRGTGRRRLAGFAEACARAVRFDVRNIIEAPPQPGRFDIILCRNVLLYFSPEMRRLAFDRLAEAIAPDGTLMLGAGETVIGQTERFVSDPDCRGLYRPRAGAGASRPRRASP